MPTYLRGLRTRTRFCITVITILLITLGLLYVITKGVVELKTVRSGTKYKQFSNFHPKQVQRNDVMKQKACETKVFFEDEPGCADTRCPASGLPTCSMDLYKSQIIQNGYFPDSGKWCISKNHPNDSTFHPNFCCLDPDMFSVKDNFTGTSTLTGAGKLVTCFENRYWKYITIVGDSHVTFMVNAFIQIIEDMGGSCSIFRRDQQDVGFNIDRSYFKKNNIDREQLDLGKRACKTCLNRAFDCTFSGYRFVLEQLAVSDVLDTSVRYTFTNYGRDHPSVTTQEFFLRYYFKLDHPNLLIWAPPFAHAVSWRRNNFKKIALDTNYLVSLVNHYIPNSTDVMWIPVAKIWAGKKDLKNYFDGYPLSVHLDMMNRGLFNAIKDEILSENNKVSSYFDTMALSCSLVNHTDHVHYDLFYYKTMLKHMLQARCSE